MFLQVLDVNYNHDKNGYPIINIYGKTEEGESKIARIKGFKPYFYAEAYPSIIVELKNAIQDSEIVDRYRPVGWQAKPSKMLKITTKSPLDVRDYREKVRGLNGITEIYEADVPFKTRFMVDKGIFGMGWIDVGKGIKPINKVDNAPLRCLSFDIEVLGSGNFPTADKDPIIMVSMAFNPPYRGQNNIVLVADNRSCTHQGTIMCETEYETLKKMVEIIKNYDPDILAGYNINEFDIPYIDQRMQILGISPAIGRDGRNWIIKEYNENKDVSLTGRIIIDLYKIIKSDVSLTNQYSIKEYKLKTVSKTILGTEKIDVEAKDMSSYWFSEGKNYRKFISYSRRDAVLVDELMNKLKLIERYSALSRACGALMQEVVNGGQSARIENLLMRRFKPIGRVMGMKPPAQEDSVDYQGAEVLPPIRGLHDFIDILDFRSLYPTIIIAHNLCPTTVFTNDPIPKTTTDPNGNKFAHPDITKGVIPQILDELLTERIRIKTAMKKASGDEKDILDAQQYAIKILLNSFYGYSGYKRSRIYSLALASAVTAYGRENIMKTKDIIEKHDGLQVIYGDTDSVFVKIQGNDVKISEAEQIGKEIAKEVSATLPEPMELVFEAFARRVLLLNKKRYAMWRFEQSGDSWKDKIKSSGIETKRRDWCELTSKTLTQVLETLLKTGNIDAALNIAKTSIRRVRNEDLRLLVSDIMLTKTYTKEASEYKNKQPHVTLIEKMKMRGMKIPMIGERVPFIIVKNGFKNISDRAEDPEYAIKSGIRIDTDYYIEKQLVGPLGRIFGVFGIEEKELTALGRQVSLMDF